MGPSDWEQLCPHWIDVLVEKSTCIRKRHPAFVKIWESLSTVIFNTDDVWPSIVSALESERQADMPGSWGDRREIDVGSVIMETQTTRSTVKLRSEAISARDALSALRSIKEEWGTLY
ncbi:uncharacterized protein FIBRA_02452 [Fibroporia radiculosa]|uniref:Uncharacterized protein n=1 Tax=Fibroporia radiculosa TaxID=599839 RepID=J4HUZ2_9APHY|nr:uncharacterized protein FIBRA_02452 [Fibroporia radiculosa]CCM00422.1 predicted protein [Fibroporia radiculosa]